MLTSTIVQYERPRLFIGGVWLPSAGDSTITVNNPATGATIGFAALAGSDDVDLAVSAARRTFDSGVWRNTPPNERARVLRRAADILEKDLENLAQCITSELGCPLWFSRAAHVPNPIRNLRYYADLCEKYNYDEYRTDGTNRSLVTQVPVGVVAAITPWNGPLSTPTLKVAPALAAGCSVILKPPPETPLTAYALAEALTLAGLPEGVLSIIPGDREAGEHLVSHPDVDKIAFTGSTLAGKRIMSIAAQRIARVTLELGGKSAAIILDDADMSTVIPKLLPMALLVNGQACIAQTRILVPSTRTAEITEALSEAMKAQIVGDPMQDTTKIGPMVSARQQDRVQSYIDIGRSEGATIAVGGVPPELDERFANGWFVAPTLFTNVDNSMRIAQEEIFGPVLTVIEYSSDADAARISNESRYGLSGSVWSSDPDRALGVARSLRTGMVSLNGQPQSFGTPFGGFKESGVGREMGPEGFESYLETMSISVGL